VIDKLAERDLEFVSKLFEEVNRARQKFPDQDAATLFMALSEEKGEVAQAILQKRPAAEIKAEIVQVGAMALRLATECDFDPPGERKPFRVIDGSAA
jgi:NTP pyrophosphatase (non-canonical NTP hydrolase)